MARPATRDELLALPIAPREDWYSGLATLKVEGIYAAQDDEGDWWGLESLETGWARRRLPCAPAGGL